MRPATGCAQLEGRTELADDAFRQAFPDAHAAVFVETASAPMTQSKESS